MARPVSELLPKLFELLIYSGPDLLGIFLLLRGVQFAQLIQGGLRLLTQFFSPLLKPLIKGVTGAAAQALPEFLYLLLYIVPEPLGHFLLFWRVQLAKLLYRRLGALPQLLRFLFYFIFKLLLLGSVSQLFPKLLNPLLQPGTYLVRPLDFARGIQFAKTLQSSLAFLPQLGDRCFSFLFR
jgi:hypothetical protein